MYVHVCICMYMYVYVCICMHVYVCICLYMCVYVCICVNVYVYLCICLFQHMYVLLTSYLPCPGCTRIMILSLKSNVVGYTFNDMPVLFRSIPWIGWFTHPYPWIMSKIPIFHHLRLVVSTWYPHVSSISKWLKYHHPLHPLPHPGHEKQEEGVKGGWEPHQELPAETT